jgi:hypothetical protein
MLNDIAVDSLARAVVVMNANVTRATAVVSDGSLSLARAGMGMDFMVLVYSNVRGRCVLGQD